MKDKGEILYRRLDRGSMAVMAAGIGMVLQPWIHLLFRFGFAVILMGLFFYLFASRLSTFSGRTDDGQEAASESEKKMNRVANP